MCTNVSSQKLRQNVSYNKLLYYNFKLNGQPSVHSIYVLLGFQIHFIFHLLSTIQHQPPLPMCQTRLQTSIAELWFNFLSCSKIEQFVTAFSSLPLAVKHIHCFAWMYRNAPAIWFVGLILIMVATRKSPFMDSLRRFCSVHRVEHLETQQICQVMSPSLAISMYAKNVVRIGRQFFIYS